MLDWDDLRFVLAVARAGSALRAARVLDVNQSTVMRRVGHIEEVIGSKLFDRKPSGYVLTAVGQQVALAAARVETEVNVLESLLGSERRALSGCVRVTASELMANLLVTPMLKAFRKEYPGVVVELAADDRRFDIARGEADVALRASSRPEGARVVARRLPDMGWSFYCGRSYAEEHGKPHSLEHLDGHAVVAADGRLASLPGPQLLARLTPNSRIAARSNSLTNLISALRAGLGLGALPRFAGDLDADLVQCGPHLPELDAEVWLIVREDIKSAPHVRAFTDFLVAHMLKLRDKLAGARAP